TVAMNPLRQRAELVFSVLVHHRGAVGWDDHQAIRDAIVRRDVELAAVLTTRHLDEVVGQLESHVAANPSD
ncbi:MAG TPA: FCD domain-containing protein, partial [Jatrophihabitans sp.]|nr:FCD domain-containing protein [Jatrophihabitans sp.]